MKHTRTVEQSSVISDDKLTLTLILSANIFVWAIALGLFAVRFILGICEGADLLLSLDSVWLLMKLFKGLSRRASWLSLRCFTPGKNRPKELVIGVRDMLFDC